jgi:cytochrome c oxidase subunit 1
VGFYLGLTLLVVGSWIVGYSFYFTYYAWRKENPDARTLYCAGHHDHDGDVADRHAGRRGGDLFQLLPNALAPVLASRPLAWTRC